MAALSLMIVTVWLREQKKNPSFTLWPTLFMYITTLAATLVTARNLLVTIVPRGGSMAVGAWAMILIAGLLFITALIIGWDGIKPISATPKPRGRKLQRRPTINHQDN
jgi:carbon starvation protein CstA